MIPSRVNLLIIYKSFTSVAHMYYYYLICVLYFVIAEDISASSSPQHIPKSHQEGVSNRESITPPANRHIGAQLPIGRAVPPVAFGAPRDRGFHLRAKAMPVP